MIISTIGYFSFPLFTLSINKEHEKITIEKIEKLQSALLYYFDDINNFPISTNNILEDLLALEKNVNNDSRWKGPYIYSEFSEKDYITDGWNNYFLYYYTSGDLFCELRSSGADGKSYTEDDIVKIIDAVHIVKKKINQTRDKMLIINSTAERYRIDNGSYPSSIYSLIPNYLGDSYRYDAWGNEFYVLNGNSFYSIGQNEINEFGEGDDIK